MLKKTIAGIDNIFGEQKWEKLVETTKDKRIQSLLKTISIIRFCVFPIAACIYTIGFALELLTNLLYLINSILLFLFECVNDSIWINCMWYGLKAEEIDEEIKVQTRNIKNA